MIVDVSMVKKCCAYECGNEKTSTSNLKFHQFPLEDIDLCAKWVYSTKREKFVATEHTRICEDHFTSDDYLFTDSKHLKPGAIPSVFSFPKASCHPTSSKRKAPKVRSIIPEKKRKIDVNVAPPPKSSPSKEELKKKIKILQQKVRRKEKKIHTVQGLIDDMAKKKLLENDISNTLKETFSGLPLTMIENHLKNQDRESHGNRHSDEVKRFAMTLHFYSPRGYDYMRSVFSSLPHPSSMANWTSSIDCEPGFFINVFQKVSNLTEVRKYERDVTLICDGMSIRSNIFYNKAKGSYEGFVTYGKDIVGCEEDIPAKEALVFMIVSLRGRWKYPVGYVLIDKINAMNLQFLLSRALDLCQHYNLKVRAITMDGTHTNMSAMKRFGCDLSASMETLSGKFNYGAYNYPLYFIPDACHMLKLARNALCDLGSFVDGKGRKIEWKFFAQLHDVQMNIGLKFGNKISAKHIAFKRNKMNVKLAAQVLSSSVADAVEYLRVSCYPGFSDSEGTVAFIRCIDKLFDLLNSRNPFAKGYKKPLRIIDKAQWISTIDSSVSYLFNLKDSYGTPLVLHRRQTFVVGLIVAALSTKELALSLLTTSELHPFSYVLTYKFSQDHLELLFSCIRSLNGFNNNPDLQQFKSAIKRILLRASVTGSKYGNCENFDSVSSPIFALTWKRKRSPLCDKLDDDSNKEDDELKKIRDFVDDERSMSVYKEAILAYIGGFVVRKMRKSLSCNVCTDALLEKKNINAYYLSLTHLKNKEK